ncbi:MAG: APC family permease, partial [Anaerolineae bacterium]|nr:APC family permease [Anaerolineae bacterium]
MPNSKRPYPPAEVRGLRAIISIKHLLIGPPLPMHQAMGQRLDKIRALAAFSPDALSSIAYANQEIYLGLLVAGGVGLSVAFPIGIAIVVLLMVVALSYYQTIHGYPSGGGSYVVARENLGTLPGLIAAAALLIGYLLTAAVSLTAGVAAIASAFPVLWPHRVALALFLLLIMTVINLRGMRETGTLMAIPVYLFLLAYLPMLGYGLIRLLIDGPVSLADAAPPAAEPLTVFLVLKTFAAGCTALTGVEAISNGVPAFRPPESRNAGRTLAVMALLMGLLFFGSVGLTQFLAIVAGPEETILSALARRLLGSGAGYLVIQISTMLILTVAANTSFAGFPRLATLLAADNFLPRQLANLGDRLVFANGILLLAVLTGALIVLFGGDTHALTPLFAVGVFLAFTLSQFGMVHHWWRERGQGWLLKAAINGLGALATGATMLVIGVSKFVEGAWIVVVLVPTLVMLFLRIHKHYHEVAEQLLLGLASPVAKAAPSPRVVIPVPGVHRGINVAVSYARSIAKDVTAVYVELEPGTGQLVREKWERWWPEVPLVIQPSPYRSLVGPLLDFLDQTDAEHDDGQLATVVLPEFVPAKWWHSLLHNQTAWLLKAALLYRR